MLTSILAASGIDVGESLVSADRHNRKGYFEDVDFLALNRRILSECCDPNDGGHPDWGWTESETLDRSRIGDYRGDAEALLDRLSRRRRWGFKDPRTTLLLDFWHDLFDDPRYLLVYRLPWQVADSMQRLGADVFLRHPEYGLRIWTYYNRHLLDFYRRHRDRALLISTNAVLDQPDVLADLLRDRLDVDLDPSVLDGLYDAPMLASSSATDPLIDLVSATSPETVELLAELDAAADVPAREYWNISPGPRAPEPPPQPRVSVVIPCRNHGQFLIEAVASVERSMSADYELIIVDDGSTEPRTLEVFDVLRAAGYRVDSGPPSGLSAARNRGINAAVADYILPLDADNRLRPGFIEPAIEALDAGPELGAVYGEPWEFGLREGRRSVGELDIEELLESNRIDACALVRKATWWDVGGYDEALPAWEDWDFWIRLATRGWGARRLDLIAFDYRVRPNSLVTITEQDETLEMIVDRVTSKHRQLFHGHLTKRLGHALAAWPRALERKHQKLAETLGTARLEHAETESYAREVEQRARDLEASLAGLRLELERSRIERLELERLELERSAEAERVANRAERRRLEAHLNHEREAKRAQEHLFEVQADAERARVDAERAAERAMAQLELLKANFDKASRASRAERAEVEELRSRLSAVKAESEARRQALDAIHSSRAFRWVQRWWRLARRLKSPQKAGAPQKSSSHPEAPVSPARSPVEDGL
ncbi:MAG: glycosyltransferase [Acidobacteriota bacterium]